MKIAYIMNSYPMTSTTFIRREILALERRGVDILRIALRTWDGELVEQGDQAEHDRTRYVLHDGAVVMILAALRMFFTSPLRFVRALSIAYATSKRADRPLYVHLVYLAEACRIEPWLRDAGIHHVHAHFGTNTAEVALLLRVLGGPQWSFTVHGPEEFDKAEFIGLSEKIRHCSFVVAISSYTRSQLYRWAEFRYWSKVHVVHCGLEAEYFARPVISEPAGNRLVCVGRLCEQKGQLLLVEAAYQLVVQGIQFELVLAGDGEMRANIEALIASRNLQSRVRITGWISSEQVCDEILAARALVLPSFAEGLPVVIMEAMALGRPIISTFVGGIPELIETIEHGWLVPAGDVNALAHAMQLCLSTSEDTLVRMSKAVKARVIARHSIDAESAKLASLLQIAVQGESA